MSKYSGIGDLIDENMALKEKLRGIEKKHIKNLINFLLFAAEAPKTALRSAYEQLKMELKE